MKDEFREGGHPARTCPFQRFTPALSDDGAWFGVGVSRYLFTVWLFHPLHSAGFTGAPSTYVGDVGLKVFVDYRAPEMQG